MSTGIIRAPFAALFLGVCCATGAALAGEPYAVIDVTDWDRVEMYSARAQIASIDGKDYLNETRRTLPPGLHHLEFLTTRVTKANKIRERKGIDIDLKPCTTYYFYASHKSKFDADWELKLLRTTEIKAKSCTK